VSSGPARFTLRSTFIIIYLFIYLLFIYIYILYLFIIYLYNYYYLFIIIYLLFIHYVPVETPGHGGEADRAAGREHEDVCGRGPTGAAHRGQMFRRHDEGSRVHRAQDCEHTHTHTHVYMSPSDFSIYAKLR